MGVFAIAGRFGVGSARHGSRRPAVPPSTGRAPGCRLPPPPAAGPLSPRCRRQILATVQGNVRASFRLPVRSGWLVHCPALRRADGGGVEQLRFGARSTSSPAATHHQIRTFWPVALRRPWPESAGAKWPARTASRRPAAAAPGATAGSAPLAAERPPNTELGPGGGDSLQPGADGPLPALVLQRRIEGFHAPPPRAAAAGRPGPMP